MPWITLPDGLRVHVRVSPTRSPRCAACQGRGATYLCDHVDADGLTCDAPLCARCTVPDGPGRDLCPDHVSTR